MSSSENAQPQAGALPATASISKNTVFLGIVSFLTDVSSEMTITLVPLFLSNVLKVATGPIGVIEGVAETTASVSRLLSGWLSDRAGRRKPLTVLGYSVSAFSKPLLYFAGSWGLVLAVRFSDRLGKGVRTAPRDALIAESAPGHLQGLNFGFHRSMDTAGAFVGLAFATLIVYLAQGANLSLERQTFQILVLAGALPAILAVAVLLLFVKDIRREGPVEKRSLVSLDGLSPRFFTFLGISSLFTLGNSSDAFLILRAHDLGLSVFHIALLLLVFNFCYAALATPAGALSDRLGRKKVLVSGWVLYALVYLGFATSQASWHVWPLYLVYGVYYAMSEGVARAMVSDLVPSSTRGAAYGAYHTAIGVAAFPASVIAGVLWQGAFGWQGFGPSAPFYFGAALAITSALILAVWFRTSTPAPRQALNE